MAKLAMLRGGETESTLQAPEGVDAAVDVIVSHSLAARILETGIVADDFAATINRPSFINGVIFQAVALAANFGRIYHRMA